MGDTPEMTQTEVNTFCRAASAVYYAIVMAHAQRAGEVPKLPKLLCPEGPPPCPCEFTAEELDEAEAFLVRLGAIGER